MNGTDPPPETVAPPDGASSSAIARNAFYLVLGQVVTTALAIVMSAALGRSLGAEDFGRYYLITTMSTFAYVFVEWGQALFVIRQIAVAPARSGELLGTALALRVAFAVAAALPTGFASWALGYGAHTTWLAVGLVFASLPLFLAQAYGMGFRARDLMGKDAAVSVSNKAIALAIVLPALALGMGIGGILLALGLAGIAALAVAVRLYARLGSPPLRVSGATARELLAGGAPIVAMTAAISAQPYLDALILAQLAPANAIGWFGAAKNILGTLMAPATILGAAAYPRVARASEEFGALRREVRAVLRPLLWLAALGGTGTYLFAGTVVGLIYGKSGFGPAATILEAFSPGIFLLFVDILLGNIIYACGGGTGFAIAKIISVAVGTGLDVLLIPFFQARYGNGGIGVVVAFALSEFVVFAGAMMVIRRGTFEAAAGVDVLRALGSAAATLLLFRIAPAMPAWAGIPLCVGAFALFSLAFGLVTRRDLAMLQALAKKTPRSTPSPAGTGRPPSADGSLLPEPPGPQGPRAAPAAGGSTRSSQHSRQ